jgi:hypothetical protein
MAVIPTRGGLFPEYAVNNPWRGVAHRANVAVLKTLHTITGLQELFYGPRADTRGLRTRSLQVIIEDASE